MPQGAFSCPPAAGGQAPAQAPGGGWAPASSTLHATAAPYTPAPGGGAAPHTPASSGGGAAAGPQAGSSLLGPEGRPRLKYPPPGFGRPPAPAGATPSGSGPPQVGYAAQSAQQTVDDSLLFSRLMGYNS